MQQFKVIFGSKERPRLVLDVYAENRKQAVEQNEGLAQLGERVDALPVVHVRGDRLAVCVRERTAAVWGLA